MFLFKRDGSPTVYVGEEDLRLSALWNLTTGRNPLRLPELQNLEGLEAQVRLLQMVRCYNKIEAIRFVITITGWDLRKSKNWVEQAIKVIPGTDVRCLST